MRIYMDNNTGNICLLTFINSKTNRFQMEYEWGFLNAKSRSDVCDTIDELYTEIGYLS